MIRQSDIKTKTVHFSLKYRFQFKIRKNYDPIEVKNETVTVILGGDRLRSS